MAKSTGKSSIYEKLKKQGVMQAHKTYKAAPVEMPKQGGGEIPAGIENGVAKLVALEMKEYGKETRNPGKPFVFLSGVCMEPDNVKGQRCKGLRVNKRFDLFQKENKEGEVYQTFEEGWKKFLNELKKLGVDTSETDPEEIVEGDILSDLVEEGIHFKFSTWQPKDSDYVNITLRGLIEDYEEGGEDEEESEDDSQDETDAEESDEESSEEDESESEDLLSLGKAADEDEDETAAATLAEKAEEAGINPDDYDTWTALAKELSKSSKKGEESEEVKVGDIMEYEGSQVTVKKVYPKKKTADVEDMDTEEIHRGVSWSDLSE